MMKSNLLLLSGLFATLTGCMTNATVELTKAPFDATTRPHQRHLRRDQGSFSTLRRTSRRVPHRAHCRRAGSFRAKQRPPSSRHKRGTTCVQISPGAGANICHHSLSSRECPHTSGRTSRRR